MASSIRHARNYLVYDGQSLLTLPAGNTVPTLLANVFTTTFRANPAVGGASWTYLLRTMPERVAKYFKTSPNTILIMLGGTSDIYTDNDTAQKVYDDHAAYAVAARAAGADYIICCTITPSDIFSAGQEIIRAAANVKILADASVAFNAVCNIAAVSGLDNYASAYYSDALHFSITGAQLCADTIAPYITAALA